MVGIPATYIQATPDLMMGDLLKTMRSSQIFSVCGLPDIAISQASSRRQTESRSATGRAARAGHLRPDDDGGATIEAATTCRPGCSTPTTTGSSFHVSPGVLPAHGGLGQPEEGAQGEHDERVGSPGRHGQRAVRGRRASARSR